MERTPRCDWRRCPLWGLRQTLSVCHNMLSVKKMEKFKTYAYTK